MQLEQMIRNFVSDEEGVTMIEYALLAGLISVVAIVAIGAIGGDVNTIYGKIQTALSGAAK